MPVKTTSARRPVFTGAAVAATAILAMLHDAPPVHALARHLLYLVFGAMAAVSLLRLFSARPSEAAPTLEPTSAACSWRSILPLVVPAVAVALFALMAIWGGFGLNNNLELHSGSLWIHAGGVWQSMRGERAEDLWKLFHPRLSYTMKTPADFGLGHFRPLEFLFLWLVSGSLVTVSVSALIVHALNATGLVLLARRWGADTWIAAASGTLFAVHPLPWQALSNTDDLHYAQGMACIVAALWCYDQYARRGQAMTLTAAAVMFGLSCLFVESFLGAAVFVVLLTFVFLRTGRVTRRRAVWGVAVFGLVTALVASALLFIELTYAPANRMGMLQVTLKRLAPTAFFEPQFGFFHPLEPGRIILALQLFAVPLGILAGFVFSSMWGPYSSAAWLASGFMLGPALAFFEVTSGGWSSGRLAYGPAFLLCLSLATVSPSTHRALILARCVLFGSALAACLITFGRIAVA